jgi:hypothetical protein
MNIPEGYATTLRNSHFHTCNPIMTNAMTENAGFCFSGYLPEIERRERS